MVECLNGDVDLDDAAVVRSVESFVDLSILGIQTDFGGINFEFDDGYRCCADEVDVEDIVLGREYLLQVLEGPDEPEVIGYIVKIGQDLTFNSDVDIAILDSNSAGTTSEQLDAHVVVAQQKLNPFIGNNPTVVVLVGLLRNFVSKFLQLIGDRTKPKLSQVLVA